MGALIELLDRKLAKCPTPSLFLSPTNKVSKGFLKHPHMDAFGDKVIQEAGRQPGTHDSRVCVCVCVCYTATKTMGLYFTRALFIILQLQQLQF